ncbi:nucleolar complex-associated protein 2 [Nicotiana tabacum]|uniref:Nucleolar complex protein 2 homolog isoform X1 n=2 Tax=Nicotiana tabacum TaxID=4097 RepID=A0A1S3ZTG8_TOBAC|nr:PREDICTED: nucleolar complex protein 2 homolog isoform X1 [Nicotiana tabacum]
MGTKNKASEKLSKKSSGVEKNTDEVMPKSSTKQNAMSHVEQLKRLQEKDPEFYQFLQEHDKELLEFDDEDIDDDAETEIDGDEIEEADEGDEFDTEQRVHADGKEVKSSTNVITSAMVDSWCGSIHENRSSGAIRSLMRAFRTACHYGDDAGEDAKSKWSTMSSSVFNKIMLFVLKEMDGILRGLLKLPTSGGQKQMIKDISNTKRWKSNNHLVKSYLGNALHVLNQMTDAEMISFTLRRLRFSSVFLAAFPVLLRKYMKVLLHFWGTGGGALPVVSFLFLRDLCMQLGSDCIDECIRGMYKAYLLNCQFMSATKLQHIQFLGNCFVELLRVDLPNAYQHAFVFIRQLAMILREAHSGGTKTKKSSQKTNQSSKEAHNTKAKESFLKVYQWKYIHCLELWTAAICAYSSEPDFRPLAYPLTQIISGAARLVPTARYFPFRLRCIKMLNRIAASTNSFVPVSTLLLDMLEIKELHRPPTGGVGKAIDFRTVLRVSKLTLKTRAFQEACVLSVVEELAEHLAQWSYSVAFFELSFVPVVRLRNFCKSTNVERFRREIRQIIREIEANSEYTNKKRTTISFLPNDPAAESCLEDDKNAGVSPLSKYVAMLRQRAQQRNDSLKESSVLVGQNSAIFGTKITESDEDDDDDDGKDSKGDAVFSSSWLPAGNTKAEQSTEEKQKKKKRRKELQDETAFDEDIVEDFILSSDEEEDSMSDAPSDEEVSIKQKSFVEPSKKKGKSHGKKNRKRKRSKGVASAV